MIRTGMVCAVTAVLLGGCASVVPEAIRSATPGNLQVAQVREHPEQFRGAVVRWGGNIISTRNESDHTIIEIVARDLDGDGRPLEEDRSLGRFIVKVQGFLDPTVYKPERELTVHGRIEGVVEQAIGEYRYAYPVVQADNVYLWKQRHPPQAYMPYRYPYPYYYDPWYPWGWPYYRPWPY
jgi:outer membrane lipoprotein